MSFVSLKDAQIKKIDSKGTYADGDGLYLQVSATGGKSWLYRYQLAKKRRSMGLGAYPAVGLSAARKLRDKSKLQVRAGIDPLQEKATRKLATAAAHRGASAKEMTFDRCAEEFIESKQHEWKNAKHAQQWRNTLTTYASPVVGELPVADVTVEHLVQILRPIWQSKTETATRVRSRVELVLDSARVKGHRTGENPAVWRGNLSVLLSKPSKLKNVKHHTALPYTDIAALMVELQAAKGTGALALQFTILCATRTSETLNATWAEINLADRLWTIPGERMKAGVEHRIPLCDAAVTLLTGLPRVGSYVFPGQKRGRPLSNMSMTTVLRRMDRGHLTVHGFRSTFRDWVAEATDFSRRAAETSLAHGLKDKTEAAYQRGDLMEKRRELMHAWSVYCLPPVRASI